VQKQYEYREEGVCQKAEYAAFSRHLTLNSGSCVQPTTNQAIATVLVDEPRIRQAGRNVFTETDSTDTSIGG